MSENSSIREFTVGLFGIGLDAYWPQFEGLQQRLTGYIQEVAQRLERPGIRVINLGLVDSPEKAQDAGHAFRRHDVDLTFLYVTTYALSSTVLPVVRRARVPVILLNLSPAAAIDYKSFNQIGDRTKMTGEWLAYCQACPVPEIANVFRRCQIPFFQVTGVLDNDPLAWDEISAWIEAGRVDPCGDLIPRQWVVVEHTSHLKKRNLATTKYVRDFRHWTSLAIGQPFAGHFGSVAYLIKGLVIDRRGG